MRLAVLNTVRNSGGLYRDELEYALADLDSRAVGAVLGILERGQAKDRSQREISDPGNSLRSRAPYRAFAETESPTVTHEKPQPGDRQAGVSVTAL
jgi:hypothetical protein